MTLPSNIACSVSFTDLPYLIHIVYFSLKMKKNVSCKIITNILYIFSNHATLGQLRIISSVYDINMAPKNIIVPGQYSY